MVPLTLQKNTVGVVSYDQFTDHRTGLFLPLINLLALVFRNCFHSIDCSIDRIFNVFKRHAESFLFTEVQNFIANKLQGNVLQVAREMRRQVPRAGFVDWLVESVFLSLFVFSSRQRLTLHLWLAEKATAWMRVDSLGHTMCSASSKQFPTCQASPTFVWNSIFILGR